MKKHLSTLMKSLLTCCMACAIWIPCTSACVLFFGEYEYPDEKDYISK